MNMPTNLYIEEITDEDFSNSGGVDAPQLTCKTSVLSSIPGVATGGSSAALLNSKKQLYLFGGCSRSGECSSALTCFDIDTSTWAKLLPMDQSADSAPPSKRFGASIAANGTKVAVFGGGQPPSSSSSSVFFNDLHVYDTQTNKWSCADPGSVVDESAEDYFGQTSRPMPRNSHTAVATPDGKMLLFGGANAEVGPMNDMWTLNLRSLKDEAGERELQWERIGGGGVESSDNSKISDNSSTPWPEAREMHSACIVSSSPSNKDGHHLGMIVMGGRKNDDSVRQDMWMFDIQSKRWRKLTDAARPRCSHTSVYLPNENVVVFFGGWDGAGIIFGEITIFDLTTESWIDLDSTAIHGDHIPERFAHVACDDGTGSGLYVLGGVNAENDLQDLVHIALKRK